MNRLPTFAASEIVVTDGDASTVVVALVIVLLIFAIIYVARRA